MNFKEALIAHLQGEKVECREGFGYSWQDFGEYYSQTRLETFTSNGYMESFQFRLAPRTIFVNGVEVPAPESDSLPIGKWYYIPIVDVDSGHACSKQWFDCERDFFLLKRGLVYLNKEDAIPRAKAMLLTSDNQQELSVSQLADKMAERRGYICQSVTGSRDGDTMTYTIECVRPNKSDA